MKKRRLISLILVALMLLASACQDASSTTEVTFFKDSATLESGTQLDATIASNSNVNQDFVPSVTKEEFPVLDGSTSMVPLGVGLKEAILGMSHEEAQADTEFHKTTASFQYLMNGESDILLVAQPEGSVFDEMDSMGLQYEMDPIAVEGLAFMVNKGNPIDSLTIDQVRKIYCGEIKNWSEVGGDDQPIIPFQRNAESGSQVMMVNTVMDGRPLMLPELENVYRSMTEIITGIKTYDNSANAIGYTVFYYASDMKMADGLKILKIEGVELSKETIASGEYPFTSNYYEVMVNRDNASEEIVKLYDWLRSSDGKKLIDELGYAPAPADSDDMMENAVYNINWAAFEETPFVYVMDRLNDDFIDKYIAGSSNCEIFPYVGLIPGSYTGKHIPSSDYFDNFDDNPMFGFVSSNGEIVCDPVYYEIRDFGDFYLTRRYVDSEKTKLATGFVSKDGKFVFETESNKSNIDRFSFCEKGMKILYDDHIEWFDYSGRPIIEYVLEKNANVYTREDPYVDWVDNLAELRTPLFLNITNDEVVKDKNITDIKSGLNREVVVWFGDEVDIYNVDSGYRLDDRIYSDCYVKDGDNQFYIMKKPDGGFDILNEYCNVVNSIGGNFCYLYDDFIATADSENSSVVITYDYDGNLICSAVLPGGLDISYIDYYWGTAWIAEWVGFEPHFGDSSQSRNIFFQNYLTFENDDTRFYLNSNLEVFFETNDTNEKIMVDNVTDEIYIVTSEYIQNVSTNKLQYFGDEYEDNVVMGISDGRICIVSEGYRYEHIVDMDGNVYFAYEAKNFEDFNRE